MKEGKNKIVGSIRSGVGMNFENFCSVCGRKIYLFDDYSNKNVEFICEECFVKEGLEKIVKLHRKKWCVNCRKKRMKGVFVPLEEKFKEGYEIGKVFCAKCGGELI